MTKAETRERPTKWWPERGWKWEPATADRSPYWTIDLHSPLNAARAIHLPHQRFAGVRLVDRAPRRVLRGIPATYLRVGE